MIAGSHNEMFGVRRTFPSFDEPQLKAYFDVKLQHPKDYTATSNTLIETVEVFHLPVKVTVKILHVLIFK